MILTKAENLKELCMLELQGEIQYVENLDGLNLGKYEESGQRCKLAIGNHVLKGKIEELSKPLFLVQKVSGTLVVVGLIKKKVTFFERPAPIPDFTKQKMKPILRKL